MVSGIIDRGSVAPIVTTDTMLKFANLYCPGGLYTTAGKRVTMQLVEHARYCRPKSRSARIECMVANQRMILCVGFHLS